MERQEGSEPVTQPSANVGGRQARIDFLILADRADIANGKLFLMGGVVDTFLVQAFPAQIAFGVALAIEVPWNATNDPLNVRVTFQDEDGQELAAIDWPISVGRPPYLRAGDVQRVPLALPSLTLTVPVDGLYVASAALNGREEARVSFRVRPVGL